MSLESWKQEFYPVEAKSCPKELAVEHSLRKWRGLTEENLKRHGLDRDGSRLLDEDDEFLGIDSDSCALCWHHSTTTTCPSCPLAARRGIRCDISLRDESGSPYHAFTKAGDPMPMIRLLESVIPKGEA